MSIDFAAECLGISRSLAYDLARREELPGVIRLGHRLLVSRYQLLKVLNGEVESQAAAGVQDGIKSLPVKKKSVPKIPHKEN